MTAKFSRATSAVAGDVTTLLDLILYVCVCVSFAADQLGVSVCMTQNIIIKPFFFEPAAQSSICFSS